MFKFLTGVRTPGAFPGPLCAIEDVVDGPDRLHVTGAVKGKELTKGRDLES